MAGPDHDATNIDLNADGLQASISSFVWQDATLGNLTVAGIGESVLTDPTDACPYGVYIINEAEEMGYGRSVATAPNADQLYGETSTYTVCWNVEVGRFVAQGTSRFTGGTGRFEGATGETQFTYTSILSQAYDEVSGQGFSSFTATLTGTLDLPNFNAGDGDSGDDAGSTGPDCNGDGVVNGLDLLGIGCDS